MVGKQSRAIVDRLTLVDDIDFIEEVVYILGSLVNCHSSHHPGNVGGNVKGLDKLEGSGGIQTASQAENGVRTVTIWLFGGEGCILVPAVDQTSAGQSLSVRHRSFFDPNLTKSLMI